MFNVRINPPSIDSKSVSILTKTVAALSVVLMITACSGGSSSRQAEALYSEATKAFESGDYQLSLQLIDSIDSAYAGSIDVRKQCRLLKPQVIEQLAASQLSIIDSLQAINAYRGDSLRNILVFEKNAVEGYYVGAGTEGVNERTAPGLHSRVSPDFHFYLSSTSPKRVLMTSVGLEAAGESVYTPAINFDGERNNRDGAYETITFTEAEAAPLAAFAASHPYGAIEIVFRGEKGDVCRMAMSEAQRNALTACYGLVVAANNDKAYRLDKEKWTRQLEIARRQLATVADPER